MNLKIIYESPSQCLDLLLTPGYLIYRLLNTVNNKCYIGDTKINLMWRFFEHPFGAHFSNYENGVNKHLYNSMRKYSLDKFQLEIIYVGEYYSDLESKFIKDYDSFNNGYNESLSGKSFCGGSGVLGKFKMNNGDGTFIYVKESEVNHFKNLGYEFGTGKIKVHNSIENILINPDELEDYIKIGYEPGQGFSSVEGTVWMNDGTNEYMISPDLVEKRLKDGYSYGRLSTFTLGLVTIHKSDGTIKKVKPEKINEFLKNGWVLGNGYSSTFGKMYVHNNSYSVAINPSELEDYLNKGFSKGRLPLSEHIDVVNSKGEFDWITTSSHQKLAWYATHGWKLWEPDKEFSEMLPLDKTEYWYALGFTLPSEYYTSSGILRTNNTFLNLHMTK